LDSVSACRNGDSRRALVRLIRQPSLENKEFSQCL